MCSATQCASLSQVGVSRRPAALLCEPAWLLGTTARAGWLSRATWQPLPFTDQNASHASRGYGRVCGHQDIGGIVTGMRAEGWTRRTAHKYDKQQSINVHTSCQPGNLHVLLKHLLFQLASIAKDIRRADPWVTPRSGGTVPLLAHRRVANCTAKQASLQQRVKTTAPRASLQTSCYSQKRLTGRHLSFCCMPSLAKIYRLCNLPASSLEVMTCSAATSPPAPTSA